MSKGWLQKEEELIQEEDLPASVKVLKHQHKSNSSQVKSNLQIYENLCILPQWRTNVSIGNDDNSSTTCST